MVGGLVVEFEGGIKMGLTLRGDATTTVKELISRVPFESSAHRWGDEVYFEVPFHTGIESDARQDMDVGEVAFWPDGDALAIFFGRTPASIGQKPRASSPCNIVGRIDGDTSALRSVREGARVQVRRE